MREGHLFLCRKHVLVNKILKVFLAIFVVLTFVLALMVKEYRELAFGGINAISASTSSAAQLQAEVYKLTKKLEEKEKIISSIVEHNKRMEEKRFPKFKAVVTAYTPHKRSTGKTEDHPLFNVTWSGFKGGGGVCAADPRYWKMGTVLYVEGLGACVVLDTGGAIKGKYRFDYYIPGDEKSAEAAAFKWGKRTTTVIVLYQPKENITARKVYK